MIRGINREVIRSIVNEVEILLDAGISDKQKIISTVIKKLNVPRPTVRRIIRDMREEMLKKVKILEGEIPSNH